MSTQPPDQSGTRRRAIIIVGVAAILLITGVVLYINVGGQSAPPAGVGASEPAQPPPRGRRPITEVEPATGETLKVAADGSGEFTSIQDAAEQAGPGDVVLISAGSYPSLTLPNDGSENAYITFQAAPGALVLIAGEADGKGLINLDERSFIKLIGLTVRGSSSHGIYAEDSHNIVLQDSEVADSRNGGVVFLDGSDITVTHTEIRGNNAKGVDASQEALTFQNVDGFEVAFSIVSNNGEEGIDAKYEARNGKIHDNTVNANRGPNIYIDSANSIEVYNNLVTGTTEGTKAGISLAIEDLSETRRTHTIKIYNNVVSGNAGGGIGFWAESTGTFADIEIINNTVAKNPEAGLILSTGDFEGTNILRNNIFSGNKEEISGDASVFAADHNLFSAGAIGSDVIDGAVRFPETASADLRPLSGSAGIDAGSSAGAPAFDVTGAERPAAGGYDLGAFENEPEPGAMPPRAQPGG